MLAPYRIATKPEPDGPDEADAYEACLRAKATRSRRLATAACGAIAALSIVTLAETPPPRHRSNDVAEARVADKISSTSDAIRAMKSQALFEQARFAAAMNTATHPPALAEPGRPPCSLTIPDLSRVEEDTATFPLLVASRYELDLPSPTVAGILAAVNRAEEHLASGRFTEAISEANALATASARSSGRARYDLVVMTSQKKHPVRTTPTSFEPGEIEGRAYLYDFGRHRVACVGDIHAKSSPRIEYSFVPASTGPAAMDEGPRLAASLDEDLERQIRRAIRRELVQLGDDR